MYLKCSKVYLKCPTKRAVNYLKIVFQSFNHNFSTHKMKMDIIIYIKGVISLQKAQMESHFDWLYTTQKSPLFFFFFFFLRKEILKVMFGNNFCFLFLQTCFGEYKEKTIFLYFWNQKHVWLVEIKKIIF